MDKPKGIGPDVEGFIAEVDSAQKRADSYALIDMMSRVTGEKPKLSGTIVAFGTYHYKYSSGREGDACLAGFSPRKAALSIYLMGTYSPGAGQEAERLLSRLGKHKMGKACLYVNRLSDIDMEVLEQLVSLSVKSLCEQYPT